MQRPRGRRWHGMIEGSTGVVLLLKENVKENGKRQGRTGTKQSAVRTAARVPLQQVPLKVWTTGCRCEHGRVNGSYWSKAQTGLGGLVLGRQ